MKKGLLIVAAAAMLLAPSCATLKGLFAGAVGGAAVGAGIGYLITGDAEGALKGAAIGGAAGAATGTTIGAVMDKKAKELEKIEAAKIETITDANGFEAIKVTFSSGILFDFNSTALSEESKESLKQFATVLEDLGANADITILGHTDNVGTAEANEKVSQKRADAVKKELKKNGMDPNHLYAQGLSFNKPVADNETEEGRAKNRRVEIYITANEDMVKAVEAGTLK
ncbi:MAG: OmpA family protein [Bacteroidales bacterium]|nr:OmpA family protein [Bacteroidales bacterium]